MISGLIYYIVSLSNLCVYNTTWHSPTFLQYIQIRGIVVPFALTNVLLSPEKVTDAINGK